MKTLAPRSPHDGSILGNCVLRNDRGRVRPSTPDSAVRWANGRVRGGRVRGAMRRPAGGAGGGGGVGEGGGGRGVEGVGFAPGGGRGGPAHKRPPPGAQEGRGGLR